MTSLQTLATPDQPPSTQPSFEPSVGDRLSLLFLEGTIRPGVRTNAQSETQEWVLTLDGHEYAIATQETSILLARTHLELIGYDRPTPEAGWLLETKAEWLFCWFGTNELAVLPIAELRQRVLREPGRFEATSVLHGQGLSWACTEDTDHLVWKLANARILDTNFELNEPLKERRIFGGHNISKCCTVDDLVELMRANRSARPSASPSEALLKDLMYQLAAVNRMRNEPTHKLRIKNLPWKLI